MLPRDADTHVGIAVGSGPVKRMAVGADAPADLVVRAVQASHIRLAMSYLEAVRGHESRVGRRHELGRWLLRANTTRRLRS